MRGRRVDPTTHLKGNPGKRKRRPGRTRDVPYVRASNEAPKELTEAGKVLWHQLRSALSAMNMIRDTDSAVLTRYADTLAFYWEVTAKLHARSVVYDAPMTHGGTMRRVEPLFLVQDRLARRLDTMEANLGLNPRARQEILYRLAQQPAGATLAAAGRDDGDNDQAGADQIPTIGLFAQIVGSA